MQAVVMYESLTGNTRHAARIIASALEQSGIGAAVFPVTAINYEALRVADLVIVGSWTDGVFVVGQRPGRAGRLRSLPVLDGKRTAVFCTFALNPGKTLQKMQKILEQRGADVIGGMAIRRDDLEGGAVELVERLLDVVAPT